jgi:hypothetical protein
MRKSILVTIAVLFLAPFVFAQTPGYHCIYGNKDGSTIDVYIDSDIGLGNWVATPDTSDSVAFIHNPLSSDNNHIASRDGGQVHYPSDICGEFLPPDTNSPAGYTNQSLFLFYDIGPDTVCHALNTEGDTVYLADFFMHTANDSSLIGQMICPFAEGNNPINGATLWGLTDGITEIFPSLEFSCLYFVEYLAGDANGSGGVDGNDVIYLANHFKGFGPSPEPLLGGDANGDCIVNGVDVVYIVAYLKGGPIPFLGNCH